MFLMLASYKIAYLMCMCKLIQFHLENSLTTYSCKLVFLTDHPEVHKNKGGGEAGGRGGPIDPSSETLDVGNRRQAATDEIMLERFRKRERSRLMRR